MACVTSPGEAATGTIPARGRADYPHPGLCQMQFCKGMEGSPGAAWLGGESDLSDLSDLSRTPASWRAIRSRAGEDSPILRSSSYGGHSSPLRRRRMADREGFSFAGSGHPGLAARRPCCPRPLRGLADREGFEPSVPLTAHTLSRRARSTTPASVLDPTALKTASQHPASGRAHPQADFARVYRSPWGRMNLSGSRSPCRRSHHWTVPARQQRRHRPSGRCRQ